MKIIQSLILATALISNTTQNLQYGQNFSRHDITYTRDTTTQGVSYQRVTRTAKYGSDELQNNLLTYKASKIMYTTDNYTSSNGYYFENAYLVFITKIETNTDFSYNGIEYIIRNSAIIDLTNLTDIYYYENENYTPTGTQITNIETLLETPSFDWAKIEELINNATVTEHTNKIEQSNGFTYWGGDDVNVILSRLQKDTTTQVTNGYRYYVIQTLTKHFTTAIDTPILFANLEKTITSTFVGINYVANVEVQQEVIDLPGLMFSVLGMPFAWISTAFNLTIFPNTPYAINISHLFFAIIGTLLLIYIIKKVVR